MRGVLCWAILYQDTDSTVVSWQDCAAEAALFPEPQIQNRGDSNPRQIRSDRISVIWRRLTTPSCRARYFDQFLLPKHLLPEGFFSN